MVVMDDDEAQLSQVVIEFENGARRTYHHRYPGSTLLEGDCALFRLPNGENHLYDFVREIEVTPETKRIKVLATSISAHPQAVARG